MSAIKYVLVLGVLLNIGLAKAQDNKQKPPNIVYIMSDDHSYKAISAYGYNLNHTPNIDRLAKEGALFTRATVTNSLCSPSRAVLLTGKHSFINGKIDNESSFDWEQENFAKLLQAAGYQTALIGKIHMDGQPQGFDHSAVLIDQGEYYNPDFVIDGKKERQKGYVTDITTEMTIDWIAKRDTTRPFCVLYHQKAPHREWIPAVRHLAEYTKKIFPEPENLLDDYKNRGTAAKTAEMHILHHMNWAGDSKIPPAMMDELGIEEYLSWDKYAYNMHFDRMDKGDRAIFESTYAPIMNDFKKHYPEMSSEDVLRWRYQRYMQDYMATVAAVDDGVGQLLAFLEEEGINENTIIIYTSDQGFYLGEHGWFDKRFMYEESLRTPLLVRYPKEIPAGISLDQLVQNLDFAPTILDYAGIKPPASMQGESFRRLLTGDQNQGWRDAIYYTYYEYPSIHMVKRHYGIRTDRYKLIHFYYDVDEWELYDLKHDPQEMRNVYQDPEYKLVRENLHQKLLETRAYYGDSDALNKKFLYDAGLK